MPNSLEAVGAGSASFFLCSMSLFIVGLDITAVNVALPATGDQLDAELSWLHPAG